MGGDDLTLRSSSLDECADGAGGVDCEAVFAKLDLILDRELPASELEDMQSHLVACLPCADRAEFETKLRRVVRERCVDEAPPALLARIRETLRLPTA